MIISKTQKKNLTKSTIRLMNNHNIVRISRNMDNLIKAICEKKTVNIYLMGER